MSPKPRNARSGSAERGEFFVDGHPVSWIRHGSPRTRPILVLAHGAGAPYTSAFMQAAAMGLEKRNCCVVLFHFPYMERAQREGKRFPPDRAPRLLATCEKMIEMASNWLSAAKRHQARLFVGGKSMGGRMMSMLLAEKPDRAAGLIYLSYPLHAPGRTDKLRDAHLSDITVPQLFVSGSRDSLAKLELLRKVVGKLGKKATLHVVEGGDHSLALSRKEPLAGCDLWLDVVSEFVHRHFES